MRQWHAAMGMGLLMSTAAIGQVYNYNYASTAAEGYQRGMADVVRSAGAANLMNSAAAQNYADARSAEIDNRMKYTKTYFAMRDANEAYQDKQREQPLSSEAAARWAAAGAPKRLSPSQLDPVTGTINWPQLLLDPRYEMDRSKLTTMFADRTSGGGATGYDMYSDITGTCRDFQTQLTKNMDSYPQQAFLAAHRFLDSLAYEATMPAQ